jgi:HEPN domain-containing protein
MAQITEEVGGTLARFFYGGSGPSHSELDSVFARVGCKDADPAPEHVRDADNRAGRQSTNKEQRVNTVFQQAVRLGRARDLTNAILERLRLGRTDFTDHDPTSATLRKTLRRCGFTLTTEGYLEVSSLADVAAKEGRPAIEDQLARLRRAEEDPGLMLGTAKEMLESAAKYVLEETGVPTPGQHDFPALLYLARERLSIRPEDVASSESEAQAVKKILGAVWTIAEQSNYLRNREGTGHGRTLPSAVSSEVAQLVVREACSVVELMLSRLDAKLGAAR